MFTSNNNRTFPSNRINPRRSNEESQVQNLHAKRHRPDDDLRNNLNDRANVVTRRDMFTSAHQQLDAPIKSSQLQYKQQSNKRKFEERDHRNVTFQPNRINHRRPNEERQVQDLRAKRPRLDADLGNNLNDRANVVPRHDILKNAHQQLDAPANSRQLLHKKASKNNKIQHGPRNAPYTKKQPNLNQLKESGHKNHRQERASHNGLTILLKTPEEVQQGKVRQLHSSTHLSKKVILALLKDCDWDLKRAECEAQKIRTYKLERKAKWEASAPWFEEQLASMIVSFENMKISSY
jgi:hypothetical protein